MTTTETIEAALNAGKSLRSLARLPGVIAVRGDVAILGNLSQAAASLSGYREGYGWYGTPYQTADARHNKSRAVELVLGYGE